MRKSNAYPIGHMERLGRCVIKKVQDYGYKYHVYAGVIRHKFATIKKAREFAYQDFLSHATQLR